MAPVVDTRSISGRSVAMYAEDSHELVVLEPIGAELERRGAEVRATADFDEPADVGLYSCHPSRFFDDVSARWRRPATGCSVQSLHDLAIHGDAQYFTRESWHMFDLGLLPGPSWANAWARARAAGIRGPVLGMRTVGWPKMDHVEGDRKTFEASVAAARRGLESRGLGAATARSCCSLARGPPSGSSPTYWRRSTSPASHRSSSTRRRCRRRRTTRGRCD